MPTFREDLKLGTKVPQIRSDDISDGAVTRDKLSGDVREQLSKISGESDISIHDIDLADSLESYFRGEKPSRLRLIASVDGVALPVGVMDVITDPMRHQLTQILRTNYVLNEGEQSSEGTIDFCAHSDGKLYSYYRFYNRSMANAPEGMARGEWSKWKQGSDSYTMGMIDNWESSVGSITDAEIDTVIDENLKHGQT